MKSSNLVLTSSGPELPALISRAGERAAWRFLEFLTVNIRNKNTRMAYARAAAAFLRWCEGQGISELGRLQPVHVAAYIERLQGERSAPTVKQHLACIRMLFDWLVIGQAAGAGIETAIGCHTFRATGITDYLTNGGRIEVAQRMAGHSNAKTTGLYDRRNDDISVGGVERIGI
jgi:site-specific recombinase XerD